MREQNNSPKVFVNGLITGLLLQLAIGPVFFFIINLALQKSFLDGLAGVLAVTLVDYFYISLAILGIGKVLENKKVKRIFAVTSSIVLAIFGMIIIKDVVNGDMMNGGSISSSNMISSFGSVFLLTISSPMTMVFFTSLFAAKAAEYNFVKKELVLFGLGTGLATFLFMGAAVVLSSLTRGAIPELLIRSLNIMVGCLLIGYGGIRIVNIFKRKKM